MKNERCKKPQLKKELMPIAWHANRVKDWCMPEDKKRLWFLISDNQVTVVIR